MLKHFTRPKQRATLKKSFIPHQIKASYVSGTKISWQRFTGIFRHLLSKSFENAVFARLGMVQCKCFF